MNKENKVLNLIIEQGILPVFFHPDVKVSVQVLEALYKGGFRAVEYSDYGKVAWTNFLELRKFADKELPGLFLGVGSVKNKQDATEFINEGADFIVAAGVIEEVGNLVHRNDLLWIPSCLTTTEIIIADESDAKLVNIYPGNLLSPSYLAEIKLMFPDLIVMTTVGDATDENIIEWLKAGVSVLGLGREIMMKDFIETGNYNSIEAMAGKTLQRIQLLKKDI